MTKVIAEEMDLLTASYHYDLPEELIAQRPCDNINRAKSRLLVYQVTTDTVVHTQFEKIGDYLPQDAMLVFNRSKVFPSRLVGTKKSGGKAEVFLLNATPDTEQEFTVLVRARGKKKVGDDFILPKNVVGKITKVLDDGTFKMHFSQMITATYLEECAKIPIPPYIRNGESDELDKTNYQTVYAKEVGSVAAPTAGLHFTDELLSQLKKQKIAEAFVTLHVGIGTFRPVQTKTLKEHQMHYENFFVDHENFLKLKENKKRFAVGTTSLRVLESMERMPVAPDEMFATNIFLHPGVEVQSISGLITNFHLPESTLLMLVSALIGRTKALELYNLAVKERYRFFSYGDAMLIVL